MGNIFPADEYTQMAAEFESGKQGSLRGRHPGRKDLGWYNGHNGGLLNIPLAAHEANMPCTSHGVRYNMARRIML